MRKLKTRANNAMHGVTRIEITDARRIDFYQEDRVKNNTNSNNHCMSSMRGGHRRILI